MGRDLAEEEEVAEEEQVPLPNSAADPVDDVADDDSDTEELLEFEAPFDQNLCISDDIIKSASPVFGKSSVLYEVETSSTTVSTTTVTEEHGAIVISKGITTTTSVEEETGESGMEVIELKYDSSNEVTELELGSFRAHNPHCPDCNHRITKIILRKWNTPRFKRSPVIESGYIPSSMAPQHSAASQINGIVNRSLMFMTRDDKHTRHDKHGNHKHPAKSALYKDTMMNEKHLASHKAFKKKQAKKKKKTTIIENGEADDTESETDSDDEIEEPEPAYESPTVSLLFNIRRIDPLMLLEILKCIVYGGLIESITSFSVVASAAATDATTLNVFAIALAILFSGLIAFTLNLLELKNMKSNKKYRELLGNKKGKYYFAFHATLAILSYLVFGLVAPATYAFAFGEGDNRKGKILAAAAAAFACVFLLSMAKAHVSTEKDNKMRCYIKTTRYYLGLTFFVSGVAYAMGFLVEMVALELGLFTSVQRVTCYAPGTTPAWTSY